MPTEALGLLGALGASHHRHTSERKLTTAAMSRAVMLLRVATVVHPRTHVGKPNDQTAPKRKDTSC